MTREQIIRMARDCGINFHQAGWPELERFAALIAAAEREALRQQEPVAWQWLDTATFRKNLPKNADRAAWNPLYLAPGAAQEDKQ